MKLGVFRSLAFRISLIGLALSLASALLFFFTLQNYVYVQNERSLVESEELAFINSLTTLRDWIAERKREVILLSQNPLYRRLPDLDAIHFALATQLPSRQGPFLHYFVFDREGNYTTTLIRNAGNLAHRNYLSRILAGESLVSGYLISLSTGLPVIAFATPIFDSRFEVIGGFGLTIDLLALHHYFRQRLLTSPQTILYLTDGEGNLLWSNRYTLPDKENLGVASAVVPVELAERARQVLSQPRYTERFENRLLFSAELEGSPGFRLLQLTELTQLTEGLGGLQRQLILLSFLFFVVLLLVVLLVNRSWARYFSSMQETFNQVARGDFSVIAPEGGASEMARLAHGFNEMMHYIRRLVFYDTVTELPNRSYFEDFVKKNLNDPQFHQSVRSLVVLSIDKFKNFNDSHGSSQGDRLLKMTARRLVRAVTKNAIVSRGNGAEFNLFLYGFSSRNQVMETLNELHHVGSSPYIVENEKVYLTFSMGVSFYVQDATSYEELLINASIAKNSAKKAGGNQIKTFNDSMKLGLNRQMQIEAHLHIAIEYNQFYQVYHPQIDARTQRITGMEALIRWTSPELGPIPPNIFIPIAEESGLIRAIDRWSLLQACRQNKEWIDQGCLPIPISVNISSLHLEQADFIEELEQILSITQLPPSLLELEITERLALSGYEDIVRKLEAIRSMGVKISIDDFGTGYSSLNYLQNLPIQRIKIDQSFVRDLPQNHQAMGIVNTIISMGRNFGLELVAEGVETAQQLNWLVQQGCHIIQGYYFSKPMNKDVMKHSLLRGHITPSSLVTPES